MPGQEKTNLRTYLTLGDGGRRGRPKTRQRATFQASLLSLEEVWHQETPLLL